MVPSVAGSRRCATRWLTGPSNARLDLRVGEAQRLALLERHDLLEGLAEIEFEIVPPGPAEMRCAQRVRHLQKRVVAAGDRLLLVDVDRRIAWPALAQRIEQRARRDQFGATGVDDQRGRLHAGEIFGRD